MAKRIARRFIVRGRVQGVGYRAFAVREAQRRGVEGYARNMADGTVEVHAQGTVADVEDLAAALHLGPRFAEVRGVDSFEAAPIAAAGFVIR